MKYIPLGARVSSGKSVQVDDDIYEYLMQWNWIIQRHSHTSYAFRFEYIDKKYHRVNMHRVIMELCDKNLYVDHIDHDGLNNQRSNLRICTHSQNAANKKSFGVHSKYKGVCRTHGSWNVCVQKDRKAHQKTFKSEIEAALWYNEKAKVLICDGDMKNFHVYGFFLLKDIIEAFYPIAEASLCGEEIYKE